MQGAPTRDHPHAALVRAGLEAFGAGNVRAIVDLLDDDVVWHQIGVPQPLRGREAVAAAMPAIGEVDFTIDTELHDVVANDEHAIALVNATAHRGGRTLEYRTAEIMHVRDGRVVERWAFSDDTARIVDFFA